MFIPVRHRGVLNSTSLRREQAIAIDGEKCVLFGLLNGLRRLATMHVGAREQACLPFSTWPTAVITAVAFAGATEANAHPGRALRRAVFLRCFLAESRFERLAAVIGGAEWEFHAGQYVTPRYACQAISRGARPQRTRVVLMDKFEQLLKEKKKESKPKKEP